LDRDGIVYEAAILPYDVLANDRIQFEEHESSLASLHANGKVTFARSNVASVHTGRVQAVGPVEIKRGNTIHGDILSADKVKVENGAVIDGTMTSKAAVSDEPLLRIPAAATGLGEVKVQSGTQALDPGAYGKVQVSRAATLALRSGEYSFTSLKLEDDAVLTVDGSAGGVIVDVAGPVEFRKRTHVDIPAGSRCLTLRVSTNDNVRLRDLMQFAGTILAPTARVEIGPMASFQGAIVAKEVLIKNLAVLTSHGTTPATAPTPSAEPVVELVKGQGSPSRPATHFVLEQNVPNPFNPSTTISFALPHDARTNLRVFDASGRLVRILVSRDLGAGEHSVHWDGRDLSGRSVPTGIYVYELSAGRERFTKKMLLMK